MLDFQRYQLAFAAHIRDPSANKKPTHVQDTRMAIYREIVFNNIFSSVSACFPVCKGILGARAWRKLVRAFFANHQATTPIFRDIPLQFLQYIDKKIDLPIYFQSLAHYEWVELAVASLKTDPIKLSKTTDLLNKKPIFAPAHMLLSYDYAVQSISKRHLPQGSEQTFLFVFRNHENKVNFIELNPITFHLLNLIKTNQLTGKQAFTMLSEEIEHSDVDAIITFGAEILADLANQQAIIGSI